jgi:AcrR family transcriptional regulator
MPANTPPDRRARLLDAALAVAGERGLRAVTHRAVEDAAGVPRGSSVYYFPSKPRLIDAMVERLAEVEERRSATLAHAVALALASSDGPSRLESLLSEIVSWIDADRSFALAHYELVLAGARDVELRAKTSRAAQSLWRLAEPIALAAGSTSPQRDGRMIVAVLDGLLLDRLTHDPKDDELTVDTLRHLIASFGG